MTGMGESQAEWYHKVGAACVGGMTLVSLAIVTAIIVYGVQGDARHGQHSATTLLNTALMATEARLVTVVALLSGMSIDLVVMLPWTDTRCDGLPKKRLLAVCALTILLAEGPMLVLKAMYRYHSHTGIVAVLSIAVSAARLYRALLHKGVVWMAHRQLDRASGRSAKELRRQKELASSTGFLSGLHADGGNGGVKVDPKAGSSRSSKRFSISLNLISGRCSERRSSSSSRKTSERKTSGCFSERKTSGCFSERNTSGSMSERRTGTSTMDWGTFQGL